MRKIAKEALKLGREEAQKRADALIARNNALASLSQLLTADWAVTPEEKQLARKIIDRLTLRL